MLIKTKFDIQELSPVFNQIYRKEFFQHKFGKNYIFQDFETANIIQGTINNIETIGIPQCLTGPIARGDSGTITKHLNALQKVAPSLLSTYRELSRQTIPIALAKGRISQHQAQELQAILK